MSIKGGIYPRYLPHFLGVWVTTLEGVVNGGVTSGAERDRTADPLLANLRATNQTHRKVLENNGRRFPAYRNIGLIFRFIPVKVTPQDFPQLLKTISGAACSSVCMRAPRLLVYRRTNVYEAL